jgi:hypothetical protein
VRNIARELKSDAPQDDSVLRAALKELRGSALLDEIDRRRVTIDKAVAEGRSFERHAEAAQFQPAVGVSSTKCS